MKGGINALKFQIIDPDLFGVAFSSGFISVFNTQLQETFVVKAHTGEVTDLCFSPLNNKLCCSCSTDQTVKLYDVIEKKSVKSIQTPISNTSCSFSPDGQMIGLGGAAGEIAIFGLRSL
jgi:WD40 repeat protein